MKQNDFGHNDHSNSPRFTPARFLQRMKVANPEEFGNTGLLNKVRCDADARAVPFAVAKRRTKSKWLKSVVSQFVFVQGSCNWDCEEGNHDNGTLPSPKQITLVCFLTNSLLQMGLSQAPQNKNNGVLITRLPSFTIFLIGQSSGMQSRCRNPE
jgi:hypothetical protein